MHNVASAKCTMYLPPLQHAPITLLSLFSQTDLQDTIAFALMHPCCRQHHRQPIGIHAVHIWTTLIAFRTALSLCTKTLGIKVGARYMYTAVLKRVELTKKKLSPGSERHTPCIGLHAAWRALRPRADEEKQNRSDTAVSAD